MEKIDGFLLYLKTHYLTDGNIIWGEEMKQLFGMLDSGSPSVADATDDNPAKFKVGKRICEMKPADREEFFEYAKQRVAALYSSIEAQSHCT